MKFFFHEASIALTSDAIETANAPIDECSGVVDQHLAGGAAEVPERAFQTLQPRRLALVQEHCNVGQWKSRVFARQWAHLDSAKPGTFRLVPPAARRAALARDCAQMHAMFLSAPPSFDAVLDVLDDAERRLNAR